MRGAHRGARKEEKEEHSDEEEWNTVQLDEDREKGALYEHRAYRVRVASRGYAHLVQAALSQSDEQADDE